MQNNILGNVNSYYTSKIIEHGITPKGVDWNSVESQELRFLQLCSVLRSYEAPSVLDFGCGYGAMLDFLNKSRSDIKYTGFDISEEMIKNAMSAHPNDVNAVWTTELKENISFDHTIASGIFNVKLDTNDHDWKNYIIDTLDSINKHSENGFSFNMLTSYSDKEFMRENLYYADPSYFFDLCKKKYSKYVALLHDYPLYEFTIIVKK